jgi:type IV secretion system protein VirD4
LALGALPVLITLVVWGLATLLWPAIGGRMAGKEQYWFLRSLPLVVLMLPPVVNLLCVLPLPLHLRSLPARAGLLVFLAVAAYFGLTEYERLAPYVPQYGWDKVSRFADAFVILGGVLGFAASGVAARLSLGGRETVKRAKRAEFGDADWMTMDQAAKLFPETGGIVIGEKYRVDQDVVAKVRFDPRDRATWGRGGKVPLLAFDCNFGSTHGLLFAGSGGFKTTGSVIPTALKWSGPLVCLDPSTEIAPMVKDHRQGQLGRKVFVLDPNGTCGFNVLDWIRYSAKPEEDIATVARWLLSEASRVSTGSDSYFQESAFNLLTGLLGHVVLSSDFHGERTLRSLRKLISTPEPALRALLQSIYDTSDSDFVREQVGVFINMTDNTFSGVYSTASKDTAWLSYGHYADLVCGESFETRDIASGKIDVFINLKTEILANYPGIARVIVGSLINAMMQADGRHKERVLFLLDEVNLLGTMRTLETARDVGRKYGITLFLVYQSIGQLKRHFGAEGKAAWFESASFIAFAAVNDMEVAQEVSKRCGDMTIEVTNTSKSAASLGDKGGGRVTKSTNTQRRSLILPHEVTQNMRADEQIVFVAGLPPLRCGRAVYFRRPELLKLVGENRFARQART